MRVAVFRALQLGDLLCAVPALRALRAGLPSAEMTLIGLPWARALREHLPRYLDDFLEFPGWPGLPEREFEPARVAAFLQRAQKRHFDLAIQLHGNGSITNSVAALLGATRMAGFAGPGAFVPDPDRFLQYPEDEPEVCRLLRLMQHLGYPPLGTHLEFEVRDVDRARAGELHEMRQDYVCLHPGARDSARCWSPEAFAAIGDALAARGLHVVITGSASEAPRADAVQRGMRYPCLTLAGRTDLGTLAALLQSARLLVCNDTGVSHLACALQTPSVVVFLSSDPARWAPLDAQRHRWVSIGRVADPVRAVLDETSSVLDAAC